MRQAGVLDVSPSFVSAYQPKPLSVPCDVRFTRLVQAAKQRRLVLYMGAGISMAEPSGGPRGPAVADHLRPLVALWLGADGALDGLTLEELTQRVADEASHRIEELKAHAAEAFEFRTIAPNYGHEAAALLLRSSMAELISVNWDCGIERAGTRVGVTVKSVVDVAGSVAVTYEKPVYKVHGCATQPATLAMTQDEVDRPQHWAINRTQAALTGGVVAFVGLGTVGLYVREPLPSLVDSWTRDAETVVVVDPTLQPSWRDALGEERAKEAHLPRLADEFFDELLRALVNDGLDGAGLAAGALAKEEAFAKPMVAGFAALHAGLQDATADGTLRWWSDGAEGDGPNAFVGSGADEKALLAVALLAGHDAGPISVAGAGGRMTVATERRYLEILCRPRLHVGRAQAIATDRVRERCREGVYPTPRRVAVVLVESRGTPPSPHVPLDIAAGDPDADPAVDIAWGPDTVELEFYTAEDAVSGRLLP